MIRITVELLPHGKEENKRLIAQANIVNTGHGTQEFGEYNYVLSQPNSGGNWKIGDISGFPRRFVAGLNVWDLVYRVLHDAVGERNK